MLNPDERFEEETTEPWRSFTLTATHTASTPSLSTCAPNSRTGPIYAAPGRAAAMVPNIIAIDARTKRQGSYTARPDISASSPKH
jgi:hypothetical protein